MLIQSVTSHSSPSSPQRESKSASAPKSNGATPAVDASPSKTEGPPASDAAKNVDHPAEPKEESERDITSGLDKVKMEDTSAPADTEMPDAPTDRASADRMSDAVSPKSHPKPAPEKDENTDAAAPADAALPDKENDVAMADIQEQPETAAAGAVPSESTQETAVAEATPASPGLGATLPGSGSQTGPDDATAGTPPPPATADTSMSEAAQPSAKVSRERDIDSEDEPVAKRTKVDRAEEQVQVRTGPAEDRKEVEQQAGAGRGSPLVASRERMKLDDGALNDTPITEWQNKQIRQVLAGVKKTKVGSFFRLPVETLWPVLWNDYQLKVHNPTDISTMEKRLRGDAPSYATMGEFKDDLELLVQNAVSFNGEGHEVTSQAKACRDAILGRLALQNAAEPPKPERKESSKAHTTRHVEPRAPAPPPPAAGPGRPAKAAVASPAPKPAVPKSPAFALPPGSNGVPLIRRDSTKPDSRAKRPVKPAHSKDLVYDTKRKKKLPLDLRFCDEVLIELRKTKHYDINAAFMQPVDPVALNIPHYHKIIKKPMDLQSMSNKLASGDYTSAKEFDRDFELIIKNCKTFNGEEHIVYAQALRLQDLYRAEMSKKDEWMAKHAPVVAAASHAAVRDESESDDADSDVDPEHDEERKQVENRLATIQKRLEQEQRKVNEMVNSGTAEMADVEIAQSVVAMLQRQLMGERAKLANLPAKKPGKPKPTKSKKTGGAAVAAKKAAVAGAGGGAAAKRSGGTKKAAPKKKIGPMEKEVIIESLGNLDGPLLERAIDLIKKDTGQGENDAGELELDIETVSEEALVKLYEIAIKANPSARVEKERQYVTQQAPAAPEPTGKPKQPSNKSKKNKPMSKSEQERRIQQLNELRAQAGRQGSNSQEPMESIEGNGTEAAHHHPDHESEDEVDSEED